MNHTGDLQYKQLIARCEESPSPSPPPCSGLCKVGGVCHYLILHSLTLETIKIKFLGDPHTLNLNFKDNMKNNIQIYIWHSVHWWLSWLSTGLSRGRL